MLLCEGTCVRSALINVHTTKADHEDDRDMLSPFFDRTLTSKEVTTVMNLNNNTSVHAHVHIADTVQKQSNEKSSEPVLARGPYV